LSGLLIRGWYGVRQSPEERKCRAHPRGRAGLVTRRHFRSLKGVCRMQAVISRAGMKNTSECGPGEKEGVEERQGEMTSVVGGAPNWANLVEQIRRDDPAGMEELYRVFARGIRFYLCRQLGPQELDDRVHDTFLIVVQAIRRGDLREPERLMGFVRTIVRRQVAAHIDGLVQSRRQEVEIDMNARLPDRTWNPEQSLASTEHVHLMRRVLSALSERDREVLVRFYLHEEPQAQICRDMELTETQFRLLKSRAKARFGELGKKKLQQGALNALFVRSYSGMRH